MKHRNLHDVRLLAYGLFTGDVVLGVCCVTVAVKTGDRVCRSLTAARRNMQQAGYIQLALMSLSSFSDVCTSLRLRCRFLSLHGRAARSVRNSAKNP
jgi:hypothetical protein